MAEGVGSDCLQRIWPAMISAELDLSRKVARHSFIWVEPQYLKRPAQASGRITRGESRPRRGTFIPDAGRGVAMRNPVLIGYVAKCITPPPPGFEPAFVAEIASVSNCIADRPQGWLELWKHNDWFMYDSPDLARQIAADLRVFDCPITAYFLLPTRFDDAVEVAFDVPTAATSLPSYFERLGWDVVSKYVTPEFECSPLSCNGMAADVGVNAACLLPSLEAAVAFARRCAAEQPEPGSYFVVEVWRELMAA
jgi:hypothetical protein